jgi:hypothetical protein
MLFGRTLKKLFMSLNFIRRAANAFGIDVHVHRYSKARWRWSYQVDDYYPVIPVPRWGYEKPPHSKIADRLNRRRTDISALIRRFAQLAMS